MKKILYRVADGDTVLSLAQRFNMPITKIIKDNNLLKEICAGDMLYLEIEENSLYKVQPCDTLCSIAKKFNTTEQKILEDNGVPYIFYGLIIKV